MSPASIAIAVLLAAASEASPSRTLARQAEAARAQGDEEASVRRWRAALEAARASGPADEARAALGLWETTRQAADLARAQPLVAAALAAAVPGSAEEVEALRGVAVLHAASGEREAAATALGEAIATAERTLDPADELLAVLRRDLGILRIVEGRLAEAEALLEASLAVDDAAPDGAPRPPARWWPDARIERRARQVATLDLLAAIGVSKGQPVVAEARLRRAVSLATDAPALSAATIGQTLNGLARLLCDRGETREAGRLASRALDRYEGVKGRARGDVAEVLVTLAAVRARLGETAQAEALLRRARRVADVERARPVVRAVTTATLGSLWMAQGRLADAETLLEEALELAEAAVDKTHPGLLRPVQMLADCYRLRGRTTEAAGLYERALALASHSYGRRSPAALPSLSGLAGVEEQAGRAARAESLRRDALAIAEASTPADDPARAEALTQLAGLHARLGRAGSAEHLYVRALTSVERLGPQDPRRLAVVTGLASLYAGQGRREEAARLQRTMGAPRGGVAATVTWVVPPADEP